MRRTSRPPFLKDPFWRDYVDGYTNESAYWYQPKGLVVSRDNLPLIKKRLRELKPFVGQRWREAQRRYVKSLAKKGLVDAKSRSSAALARMNKVVFHSLGLAWTDRESTVFITEVGNQFLRAKRFDQEATIQRQLLKYQFSNPSFGGEASAIKVFPHLFLLDVLLRFPDQGISRREYVLFVARAKTQDDLDRTTGRIQRFRQLTDAQQKQLAVHLASFPVVKGGRFRLEEGAAASTTRSTSTHPTAWGSSGSPVM